MHPARGPVRATLERANARAWGIATGLILGGGLLVATLALVVKGGEDVGTHLGLLSNVFPGYEVSVGGAFIGSVYAFVLGYALARLLSPRRPLRLEGPRDEQRKHVRIRQHAWGLATGIVAALVLLGSTNALLLKGGETVGQHLEHLGLYLPGFHVTLAGSLIGAAWVLALGYAGGWLIGWIYNLGVQRAERA